MDSTTLANVPDDETEQALREGRSRFVAGFSQRLRAMGDLLAAFRAGDPAPHAPLRQAAHKMAGLAGMLGFPTVSQHAAALEHALTTEPIDGQAASDALDLMGTAFTGDLSGSVPSWAAGAAAASGARVLLVEDDPEQRQLVAAGLRSAGFRVITAESGPEGIELAKAERPDVILLDVDLPGLDGLTVCRRLKLEPALATVPIIFCTARGELMDRMSAFALGADAYVTKPYEPAELVMRVRRLVGRATPGAAPADSDGVLPFDQFVNAAGRALAEGPGGVVLLRVPHAAVTRLSPLLSGNLRRRDLLGRYDDSHLVVILPERTAGEARADVQAILAELDPAVPGIAMGAAEGDAGANIESVLEQADLALAEDRVAQSGRRTSQTTIVIVDDDPDVLHIMDARLRAEGYRTIVTLDGQMALDAIEKESPAVVILDLMLPKVTGFDVLKSINERPEETRPQTIVVSARGRPHDVARAFDLGTEDFLTKPFNPNELVARIARLLR